MGRKAGKRLGRRKGRELRCEEGEGNRNKREKKTAGHTETSEESES